LWNAPWETTIYQALIFLVVASPCALMAAIMPTLLSGIANGAKQGILFKNGAQLEAIGQIKAIAFDKTGTLTTGHPEVYAVLPAAGYAKVEVLQVAAALEAHSEHPVGQAIVTAAAARSPSSIHSFTNSPQNIQAHPGQGITGELDQQPVVVGQLAFVQSRVPDWNDELRSQATTLQESGKTIIWVVRANHLLGIIAIADQARMEATQAIAQLKQLGIEHLIMLTGDNQETAENIAQAVGITEVYAELLPEDKLHLIRKLQHRYGTVAMVGDGINDAPALAQATVGIAMGIAGSDVALETADIVLMTDCLTKLSAAVRLGRRSQAIVRQNIAFALGFIVLLLVANFGGEISLPLGVIGHEGSTILVTLSGLRLLK
jgi:Cd2+/Zn2+-exporting ATPase